MRILKYSCLTLSLLSTLSTGCLFVNDQAPGRISGADLAYNAQAHVGASAKLLLSGDQFTSLTVEIQAVEGAAPSQDAINSFKNFLELRLEKPSGIHIRVSSPIKATGKTSYSIADARRIEDRYRQYFAQGRELVAYFLFLDGPSSDDTPNLKNFGQAHRNTSTVIFQPTIRAMSGGTNQPYRWVLESTIMQHEFGHILGLVNLGIAAQSNHVSTEDSGHAHCGNPTCLMNFNTQRVLTTLGLITQVPQLDAACIQDLQSAGGR